VAGSSPLRHRIRRAATRPAEPAVGYLFYLVDVEPTHLLAGLKAQFAWPFQSLEAFGFASLKSACADAGFRC
jgi:hypothetical protein